MDPRPARMPWLAPYLAVKNLDRSVDFYSKAFGFKAKGMKDNYGQISHMNFFHKNTVLFMLHPEGSAGNPSRSPSTLNVNASQSFYVFVDNVDKVYEKAISNGARSVMSPEDTYWGDRVCSVVDLDGYSWSFAKYLKSKAPAKKKKTTKKTGTKKTTKKSPAKKKKTTKKATKKTIKKKTKSKKK
ncbi:VOC family protein [Spirobacillus cienkowskii]|jgi:uncharacterized glyoxalase superfamily protein PhnB|uniref:VOC family protein n=1 Tax=Spirobacillus cienkowskii TaxID=495820 RepID=A0A369KNY4_9BACT|nr:MAG: VOC family protein [Spirobacillus cienkowskii]